MFYLEALFFFSCMDDGHVESRKSVHLSYVSGKKGGPGIVTYVTQTKGEQTNRTVVSH